MVSPVPIRQARQAGETDTPGKGNLAPEDMESQRAGRPDHGQDLMSEEAAIAEGGSDSPSGHASAGVRRGPTNRRRLELIPEKHLGMSVQRCYGP